MCGVRRGTKRSSNHATQFPTPVPSGTSQDVIKTEQPIRSNFLIRFPAHTQEAQPTVDFQHERSTSAAVHKGKVPLSGQSGAERSMGQAQ